MLLNLTDDDLSILVTALVALEVHPDWPAELRADYTDLRERLERRQHFEQRRTTSHHMRENSVAAFDLSLGHASECACSTCAFVRRL